MDPIAVVLLAIGLWVAVEIFVKYRAVRVVLQGALLIGFCAVAYGLGGILSAFSTNLDATEILKDLTSGVAAITRNDDYDSKLLHERLARLDQKIYVTYEGMLTSKKAVAEFLESYDLEYKDEEPQ